MVKKNSQNHLSKEKSAYLQAHANNPVDWYPWGEEAFALAKKLDRPIFLSIGYSTCHWCHVMAHESFEDSEVAALMNESFVNIKVDKEELPEVDSLYMELARTLLPEGSGWPLNLLLTPDLKPFLAITYLPPKATKGMIGLLDFIGFVRALWSSEEREQQVQQAAERCRVFEERLRVFGGHLPLKDALNTSLEILFRTADPIYGGFKGAPKFPMSYHIQFLLRSAYLKKEGRALWWAGETLDVMARGGIYDHLGGGFARYSVDPRWIVPHFEKMLYDNALLLDAYQEAFQVTKKETYREVAGETAQYMLSTLQDPSGAFYSAQDADTAEGEGAYYLWTKQQIEDALGAEPAAMFCRIYGVEEKGNFHGKSILHLPVSLEGAADREDLPVEEFKETFSAFRQELKEQRDKRPEPFKEQKILANWNGLAIHSLVKAGFTLDDSRLIAEGERAAEAICSLLWKEGTLYHCWEGGEVHFPGVLDDYAAMIRAFLTLFEAGRGSKWLRLAKEMADLLENEFKAPKGAFYETNENDPHQLIIRNCRLVDGSEPSGNALHGENLIRLYDLTGEERYLQQVEDIFKAVSISLELIPPSFCYHLLNLIRFYDLKRERFVIVGAGKKEYDHAKLRSLLTDYRPHKAILYLPSDDKELQKEVSSLGEFPLINKATTVYLCTAQECKPFLSFS